MREILAGFLAPIAATCLMGFIEKCICVLRQSIYRPRTTDETSSPTITDDMDVILARAATTTTDSEQQHPVDVTSASRTSDTAPDTLQSHTAAGVVVTAPASRSSTVDDRDSTADQSEAAAAEEETTNVRAHRTQPSTWNSPPQSTADDDPVTTRFSPVSYTHLTLPTKRIV